MRLHPPDGSRTFRTRELPSSMTAPICGGGATVYREPLAQPRAGIKPPFASSLLRRSRRRISVACGRVLVPWPRWLKREPFLTALAEYLRLAGASTEDASGEERYFDAKQYLLDQETPGSDKAMAIASIDWNEVRERLQGSAANDGVAD